MARKPPLIEISHPISKELFGRIEEAVRAAGYEAAIDRSENTPAPATAAQFASEAIYVLIHGGLTNVVAIGIFKRSMAALRAGKPVSTVFGHPGKAEAIEQIWKKRRKLFRAFIAAPDVVEFCATLPWIGPITSYHLAKNLGADVAKPDVHLKRLADREGVTAQELCERLAKETGYRAATIDIFLWRAAADGIIRTR